MLNLKFSLILATVGRDKDVRNFLSSVFEQEYPLKFVEIIVVDQNDDGRLDNIITEYADKLCIIHIKSKEKGLSRNRNIGISMASGDILCFPDDDCRYACDTLHSVSMSMQDLSCSLVLGRIWDDCKNCSSFRLWPMKMKVINQWNYYRLTSSITLFVKNSAGLFFDERFGVGSKYGSNEDAIFVYTCIKKKKYTGVYNNKVVVYHKDQPIDSLPVDKIKSYGYGFGRFIRYYISISSLSLFFLSSSYQLFKACTSTNSIDRGNRMISLKYRLMGLFREGVKCQKKMD